VLSHTNELNVIFFIHLYSSVPDLEEKETMELLQLHKKRKRNDIECVGINENRSKKRILLKDFGLSDYTSPYAFYKIWVESCIAKTNEHCYLKMLPKELVFKIMSFLECDMLWLVMCPHSIIRGLKKQWFLEDIYVTRTNFRTTTFDQLSELCAQYAVMRTKIEFPYGPPLLRITGNDMEIQIVYKGHTNLVEERELHVHNVSWSKKNTNTLHECGIKPNDVVLIFYGDIESVKNTYYRHPKRTPMTYEDVKHKIEELIQKCCDGSNMSPNPQMKH